MSQRALHEQQKDLLLKELDHRVKNLFAVVGGMVTLSARSAATARELAEAVQGRLAALASAHNLVLPQRVPQQHRAQTTLEELVRAVLAPYIDPATPAGEQRVEIVGPEVSVGGEAATSLALVFHELATNAAKYGALSVSGGLVRTSWSVENGRLGFSWVEVGGPRVIGPPDHEGFGSILARRSMNGQLGGEMVSSWNPDGLAVALAASTERLTT